MIISHNSFKMNFLVSNFYDATTTKQMQQIVILS